jgi:hypothetical protein
VVEATDPVEVDHIVEADYIAVRVGTAGDIVDLSSPAA